MGLRLGVDIGGSAVKWVLLDEAGEVAGSGAVPTPVDGPEALVETLAGFVTPEVECLGVALPGHVDRAKGTVLYVPALRGNWRDFPLAQRLTERTGTRIGAVVNDALAFGLAELRLGAAAGREEALFVVLGTGVGGAVAHEGRILVGARDSLGQIGHLTVHPEGPLCPCGNHGCIEAYAGAGALVAAYERAAGPQEGRTAQHVATAAQQGDPAALAAFKGAGKALGRGLGDALAAFAQHTVVIGGGLGSALPLLRPWIETELARRHELLGSCTVGPAGLGPLAGAMGAALWTRETPEEASNA